MKLQINEALFNEGGITATLGEDEASALELAVGLQRNLVLGSVGPADEIAHNLPSSSADFLGYDPLMFARRDGPNGQGEYQETWTADQVLGMALATHGAAKAGRYFRHRPDPEVESPIQGTVLAILGAESREAADEVIAAYRVAENYDPLRDTEAPDSPGRRVLLGFEAARAALWDATNYAQATAFVDAHNQAQLAA